MIIPGKKWKKNMAKKYNIGDFVKVKTAFFSSKEKIVLPSFDGDFKIKSFEIIYKYKHYQDMPVYYTLNVDNEMLGWLIGSWHILHQEIDKKFLNCRFYEVSEEYFL